MCRSAANTTAVAACGYFGIFVAGCQLIVATFLWSLEALANAAATAYFCCCHLCYWLHHSV